MTGHVILWAILAPLLIQGVFRLLVAVFPRLARWGFPLALLASFDLGAVALLDWPSLPPHESLGYLVWLPVGVALVSLIDQIRGKPLAWPLGLLTLLLGMVIFWHRPLWHGPWVAMSTQLLLLVVLGTLNWRSLEELAGPEAGLCWGMCACSGLLAMMLLLTGSLRLGLLGLVLTLSLVPHLRPGKLTRSTMLLWSWLYMSLVAAGLGFSQLRSLQSLLLMLLPLSLWLARLPDIRQRCRRWLWTLLPPLLLLAPTLFLAIKDAWNAGE